MSVTKSQANTRTVDPVTNEAANVGTKKDGETKGIHTIPETPKGGMEVYARRSDLNEIKEEFKDVKELLVMLASRQITIEDGLGRGNRTSVNEYNAIKVIDQKLPTSEDPTTIIPFQESFENNGTTDMRVNGSTSSVDFVVSADPLVDKYIASVSFRIADVNATADKFGNVPALSNGCQLVYSDLDNGESIIGKDLQRNSDFVRLCQGKPSFGNTTNAFQIGNIAGNSEGYIPVLDFSEMFGMPWGLRLRAGTKEKLIIRIRDNVSGVDAFDAEVFGFKKLK